MLPDMCGQMVQHQSAQALAAKSGPHVHAFDFSVIGTEELNPTTAGRHAATPCHEEYDRFAQELLDAVSMPARLGIAGIELLFELGDQHFGVGRVGALRKDDRS